MTQNENVDLTLAFVEAVIQSLRQLSMGVPMISADGQEEVLMHEGRSELVYKCYEMVQHRLTHQSRFGGRMSP